MNEPIESLLLFGPQIPRLASARITDLRNQILEEPRLAFLIEVLKDLPELWTGKVVKCCPRLDSLAGVRQNLQRLGSLFDSETADWITTPKPHNLFLAPLTVITQVTEYVRSECRGPAQGFCIGFLSAAAVSTAGNKSQLERSAAAAVRLAVCIGALVDLDEQERSHNGSSERSSTWTLRWKSKLEKEHLEEILASFPTAYISCDTDVDRVTVTIPEGQLASILRQLADVGLALQPVGISGRYHTSNPARDEVVEQLKTLCKLNEEFQFPKIEQWPTTLRSTTDAKLITSNVVHDIALDSILRDRCRWFATVREAVNDWNGQLVNVVSIGDIQGAVPRSIRMSLGSKGGLKPLSKSDDLTNGHDETASSTTQDTPTSHAGDTAMPIAVIGMSCRFAEADSLEEFWRLIGSGKNAVSSVPTDRFDTKDLWRNPKGPFYGNFLRNPEGFDHRFFHISAREAASMDPQQRLLLEVAYEAMGSAGYPEGAEAPNAPVGCYIGAGYVEYEDNVASEDATAFSATGTIRAFVSGRISHHFGWTGPSVIFDTACSSSAVAIHNACKALQTNDCSVAVAGGVNVISSATFYQNLAAASFLSPTGASKAFDADANGYCRGEGAGVLVLKPLARAIADNDRILGTIVGSAVNQNSSRSPITVPDSDSQAHLYRHALARAGISPFDVSYVEAHGTGTPVGDPIECASIRSALGSPHRLTELVVGSVKDVIGHTESASGVAGVIKTLLMLQHGIIPKQPNFTKLNPKIPPLGPDHMSIAANTQPWSSSSIRTALVNNYGAAGSNAAVVLQEYPASLIAPSVNADSRERQLAEYPIFLSAKTPDSLRAYIAALVEYIGRQPSVTLGDVAYNLARLQNRSLDCIETFTTSSIGNLSQTLKTKQGNEMKKKNSTLHSAPVILCFGGQSSRSVHISEDLYLGSTLLQTQLSRCDEACQKLGLPQILPRIFDPQPVDDLVQLHAMLFSLQYASAMAWLDAGLQVAAVLGHSFGQLTAMCVAGCMDLENGLRLVTGRARLIEKHWGFDNGSMLAIEGDPDRFGTLLDRLSERAAVDVACYNGPRNIVLAGSSKDVDIAEQICRAQSGLKITRLANSHAYHSRLVEPIVDSFRAVAETIAFQTPQIPVETCSSGQAWPCADAERIVQHTRGPVYFGEAVQRIASRHPSCVWLEAGSGSPIIPMTRRVLGPTRGPDHDLFVPADLSRDKAWSSLASATSSLWAAGTSVDFWSFSALQRPQFRWLDLPPYQFSRSRHWITWRPSRSGPDVKSPAAALVPGELVRLIKNGDGEACFAIDTSHEVFQLSVSGHAVVGQSLCPAGIYFEFVIRAAKLLQAASTDNNVHHVEQFRILSPLGLKVEGGLFAVLRAAESKQTGRGSQWTFELFSCPVDDKASLPKQSRRTLHAQGTVGLLEGEGVQSRLRFMDRLLQPSHYSEIASSASANHLSGNVLYRIFGKVVTYVPCYKGLRSAIASGREAIGDITMPEGPVASVLASAVSDPLAIDNFLQLAGIHVNFLHASHGDEDVFVCNAVGEILWSEAYIKSNSLPEPNQPRSWKLYSNMEEKRKNTMTHDVFVLDAVTGNIVVAILEAEFAQVPLVSLRRMLAKVNGTTVAASTSLDPPSAFAESGSSDATRNQPSSSSLFKKADAEVPSANRIETGGGGASTEAVVAMLSEVLGVDSSEVQPDSSLADMGVDSLMITEISTEVQKRFNVEISMDDLQNLTDVQSLVHSIGGPPSSTDSDSTTPTSSTTQPTSDDDESLTAPDENIQKPTAEELSEDEDGGLVAVGRDWMAAKGHTFDADVNENGFASFRESVYPGQMDLVTAYTIEALASLGCDLRILRPGEQLPTPKYLPKHDKLMAQMYKILESTGLVTITGSSLSLTEKPLPSTSALELHEKIVRSFPQHASEHRLLRTTGARLADCLVGRAEPLALMFGSAEARRLMEDVYTNGPMFRAATSFLSRFLLSICEKLQGQREIRILELGAGTGGTTSYLVNQLQKSTASSRVRYTFSDVSGSLVAAAKRKFATVPFMEYAIINVEKTPTAAVLGRYDLIISTNCIHATPSLTKSCSNIQPMLRKDGMLCLVEHTQNLFWFDLVWGLVEGWWLFDDGRKHALASEQRWKEALQASGFSWVDWSDGASDEAQILRVIVASPSGPSSIDDHSPTTKESVVFKHEGSLPLNVDIYYPPLLQNSREPRPVALMIHGGGHVLLSRKDIRPKQTEILLEAGFIPVSVDYRLCPEVTLLEGPMTDVRDALKWTRTVLPYLNLSRSDICIDGSRVVAIGWSTGGHLALSLGWTSIAAGIQPPQATLAFYCPTDYEDDCWSKSNKPFGDVALTENTYNLWEGVGDAPIAGYNPAPTLRAAGGWMAKGDARSRIILHMNWHGQTVPVLVHGLKDKSASGPAPHLPTPTLEQIRAISPLAQVRQGQYHVPTFIVHPYNDDLIPWQQAQRTEDELVRKGVEAELRLIKNAVHLFDMSPRYEENSDAVQAIADGYAFLARHV